MSVRILLSCLLLLAPDDIQAIQGQPPEKTIVLELEINEQVLALTPEQVPKLIERASGDDIQAQCVLGVAYARGSSVPRDDVQAIKWLSTAAVRGISWVQNLLGSLYRRGRNVPQDYPEAVKWFHAAAEQHYPEAADNLGY